MSGKLARRVVLAAAVIQAACGLVAAADPDEPPRPTTREVADLLTASCVACHDADQAAGGLVIPALGTDLSERSVRDAFVLMHDRVAKRQMPPEGSDLPDEQRDRLLGALAAVVTAADLADVLAHGRVPLRRLNRHEYEQTLRDVLHLPALDVRDRLPEDRIRDGFNKSATGLDFSRIQLESTLDAAEAALRAAIAERLDPLPPDTYAAISTALFAGEAYGEPQARFFAKDDVLIAMPAADDPDVECAIFRSAYWPYHGYPRGFVASRGGLYRVRFRGRAVHQLEGLRLVAAPRPVSMTFRARAPSGPDVSGDVQAVGGVFDVAPEGGDYETTVLLKAGQTIEYSLLGLAVPLARNVDGGEPSYRFPPLPPDGHPGVAVKSLEIVGPLQPESWPPPSHRLLFDDLPLAAAPPGSFPAVEVLPADPDSEARRLFRRFAAAVLVQPLPEEACRDYDRLIAAERGRGTSFARAMLTGYRALLCAPEFIYLADPRGPADLLPLAQRLSYALWDTRPDAPLLAAATSGALARPEVLREQIDRLVDDPRFERFVASFTSSWLDLRHLRRDEPDARLYPEYRFDDSLVESMGMETRAFVAALVRENLPVARIVAADFVFANDRLARHYGLPPLTGHAVRRVHVPPESPYGGLLTQAAIQKVTANGTNTSPVVRGAWVMTRLLGEPPPKPPESVPAVEPDIRGARTIRELLGLHTRDAACSSCHRLFDPVGFALESFDVCGGWRDRYRGLEEGEPVSGIDRAGHDYAYRLAHRVDPRGSLPDGRSFDDIRGLKALLGGSERQLARNLLHQLTAYVTGGPVRFSDRSEIETILDAGAAEGYRVRDLLHALFASGIVRGRGAAP